MARGQHVHPVDNAVIDLHLVRQGLVEDFHADDGVICEREEAILEQFDGAVGMVAQVRLIQKAAAHLERVPAGGCTRYGMRLLRDAGYQVVAIGVDGPEAA